MRVEEREWSRRDKGVPFNGDGWMVGGRETDKTGRQDRQRETGKRPVVLVEGVHLIITPIHSLLLYF